MTVIFSASAFSIAACLQHTQKQLIRLTAHSSSRDSSGWFSIGELLYLMRDAALISFMATLTLASGSISVTCRPARQAVKCAVSHNKSQGGA